MKNIKSVKRVLFKALCLLIVGIFTNMAVLVSYNTNAYFSASFAGSGSITALTFDDVFEEISILKDGDGNATDIVIKKNPSYTGVPIVCFEIVDKNDDEFSVKDYILHINPIRVNERMLRIPIITNANSQQLARLNKNVSIDGFIKIQAFNRMIDETREIHLSYQYLKDNLLDRDSNIPKQQLTQEIIDLAGYVNWLEDETEENIQPTVQTMTVMSANSSSEETAEKEVWEVLPPFSMSSEQNSIVDVIVPKLKSYLAQVYNYIAELVSELNKRIAEINNLNMQIEELKDENLVITEEKEKIASDNQALKEEIEKLKNTINSLEERNENYRGEISYLRESLRSQKQIPSPQSEEGPTGGIDEGTVDDDEEDVTDGSDEGTVDDDEEDVTGGSDEGTTVGDDEEDVTGGSDEGTVGDEEEDVTGGSDEGTVGDDGEGSTDGSSNQDTAVGGEDSNS